jgi:elongation factor G
MSRLRTFGIVAHIDAGKTTLTERILFDTGAQSWLGSVDDGTAATDWMPAERSRGISITAAAIRVQWGGQALQVVDTPGHVDFVAEVERCLRVIDAVVVVVDGVRGVESQTRAVWRQAVAAGLPRLVFINKLDRTGADYAAVVAEVAEQLECVPVPLVVPLLSGAGAFAGLGDAITGAVQWFDGRPDEDLVPALQSRLLAAHERAVEVAADHDDAVLRDVLEGRRVEPARLQKALRAAFLAGAIVPVLGGSALYNRGVDWLLDAVVVLLPTVAELPRRGIWAVPQAGNRAAPVCGFVFKVQHLDRVWNFVRVLRGRLEAGARLVRGRQPQHDVAVEELWLARADRHEVLSEAGPGEIVVVPGEFGWRTGDTVCAVGAPVTLPQVRFPAPVLAVTFEPERAGSAAALFAAVRELAADDPTLRAERDADRIVVRGMGELHLEIVGDLVRARTGLGFRVSRPRVDRRETVERPGRGEVEIRAHVAGAEHSARCAIVVVPHADTQPARLVDAVGTPAAAAATEEIDQQLASGSRAGPLVGCEVRLVEVRGRDEDTALVQQAAARAFAQALGAAGVVVLEPWVDVEIQTPADTSAAVLADLGARGAEIVGVASGRLGARLAGRAPLARMLGYVTKLRSMTRGLGQATMRPAGLERAD